jgi:hypothetical protein
MDCWIVIAGRKLQNFAARSYSLTCIVRVFHARRSPIHHASVESMTDLPRKRCPEDDASIDLPRARS